MRGSSIRIDRYVFGSNRLDGKLKILGKLLQVSKLCQLFQSYSLVAIQLLRGDFVGGEMTVKL